MRTNRILLGPLPAVILKLLDGKTEQFVNEELVVIDAIKRSNNSLSDLSVDEIAVYIQGLSANQFLGFFSNLKGIYHEMLFVNQENQDGDEWLAELFELTNHPGGDALLTNTLTGETVSVQLKATNNLGYINEHIEKYPDIPLMATAEVAGRSAAVDSSGIELEYVTNQLNSTIGSMAIPVEEFDMDFVKESAMGGALLSAAVQARGLLKGEGASSSVTKRALQDMGIAASSAAIIELLLG